MFIFPQFKNKPLIPWVYTLSWHCREQLHWLMARCRSPLHPDRVYALRSDRVSAILSWQSVLPSILKECLPLHTGVSAVHPLHGQPSILTVCLLCTNLTGPRSMRPEHLQEPHHRPTFTSPETLSIVYSDFIFFSHFRKYLNSPVYLRALILRKCKKIYISKSDV